MKIYRPSGGIRHRIAILQVTPPLRGPLPAPQGRHPEAPITACMTNTPAPPDPLTRCATVLLADDHALMREGTKMLLTGILGRTRFLEAADGDALWQFTCGSETVHLGLVDPNIPGMQGGFRVAELAHRRPDIPLVVMSALPSGDAARRIMNIPTVFACIPKSASAEQTRAAVQAALQGIKCPPLLLDDRQARPPAALTRRQADVYALLRQGMSNKRIAGSLGISEGTVKNHITEIFRVLNASNRTQAAQRNADAS